MSEISRMQWELGGLTDKEGKLGRDVPSGHVFVPGKIELDGDNVRWEAGGPAKWVEVSRAILDDFVGLWREDSASAFLRFARQWGVLAIQTLRKNEPRYRPCGEGLVKGSDPIHAWRYFSRRACAVLSIAAALKQGRFGDLDDWRVIAVRDWTPESTRAAVEQHRYGLACFFFEKPPDGLKLPKDWEMNQAREIIAREIEMWLSSWKEGRVYGLSDFTVLWNPRRAAWELQVNYNGYLFAAIAHQLALCVVGIENLFTCTECGNFYQRYVKRPKPGTANYCPECVQNGAAQRRATDSYRQKKRQALQLKSAGTPLPEIALKLNTSEQRVRKWCGEKPEDKAARQSRLKKGRGTRR
jgi:hypothetical protein